MKLRATLAAVIILAFVAGCANRPRLRRDPFETGAGNRNASVDGASTGNRDVARDVSTSPATDDPFYGGLAKTGGRSFNPDPDSLAQDTPSQPEPFPATKDSVAGPVPATDDSESATQFAGQPKTAASPRDQYANLRNRLDAAGAQNFRSERDPSTGKYLVYCEVPIPSDSGSARAFEASDENELRAILAVVEAIEKWASNGFRE